jgi:hypothetical protein
MKTKKLIYTIGILMSVGLFLTSCEKNNDEPINVSIAEDDALTDLIFEDVFLEVEDAMEEMEAMIYNEVKKSATMSTCKVITVEHPDDSTFWPRTITVDYGEGCTGLNGRVRSGKIVAVVNKHPKNLEYYRTVTFENYFVDGFQIEGTKTIRNEGLNDMENMYFSVILEGGKVTSPEGKVMTKEFSKIREWVAGMDTPRFRRDDEYMVTGSASGINRNEVAFTRTITSPLHVALNCRWIKSGTVEIEAEGRETAILDYGDDTCDRFATVTIGDKVKTINLHR